MTTISILPANPDATPRRFRAIAGKLQSDGATAGGALDAISAQMGETHGAKLVIVQDPAPDEFFTAEQQKRLAELMARWRDARDRQTALPAAEQAELESLVDAELRGAAARAAAMLRGLAP